MGKKKKNKLLRGAFGARAGFKEDSDAKIKHMKMCMVGFEPRGSIIRLKLRDLYANGQVWIDVHERSLRTLLTRIPRQPQK